MNDWNARKCSLNSVFYCTRDPNVEIGNERQYTHLSTNIQVTFHFQLGLLCLYQGGVVKKWNCIHTRLHMILGNTCLGMWLSIACSGIHPHLWMPCIYGTNANDPQINQLMLFELWISLFNFAGELPIFISRKVFLDKKK